MAAISPRNGTTTPIMFAMRSARVMPSRVAHRFAPFLWISPAFSHPKLVGSL
jgi:hypothetical protein